MLLFGARDILKDPPSMTGKLAILRALAIASTAFTFATARASDTNIAAGKPVTTNGATSNSAALVTDGDATTYSSPASAPSVGFYFQVDLGAEYPLQTLQLYSRIDCCTTQLSDVRISVYADAGGVPGAENWGYEIRDGGAPNAQGGVDIITADLNPAGTFRGRFLRITNVNATTATPLVAEIEAYEAPRPDVRNFGTSAGNITAIGAAGKPTQATLSWKVNGATSISINQGIGVVAGPTGSVVVSPTVTTTYTLTANNGAGVSTKTLTIGVDQPELPPTLSEFLASNTSGIQDENKKRSDWVEIANPNAFAINIAGYYLTDNAALKTKWQFPSFTIPGNGFAIVWADATTVPGDPFEAPHANFSLSNDGEYLALIARDGVTVLGQFPATYPAPALYPAQATDHSYGVAGGAEGFFAVPTPYAANGQRFDGVVADTVFSVKRGFYDTTQSVAITCATPGAQIRYTTNTAIPTATTGAVYSGPISISATTVLRAAAFKTGWVPTNVDTHTYVFPATVISSTPWLAPSLASDPQMVSGLKQVPSMSLTTAPGVTINGAADNIGSLEWFDGAGGPTFHVPCGAQLFGGAFTNFAKKSFRISFKGEYGASKLSFPLFKGFERGLAPVEDFDAIELRNGSHDMSQRGFYMSNPFTDATMLDMGSFAPHGRFVHLYLNGVYWGIYHLRERWGADMMSRYYGGDSSAYDSVNGNLNVGGWADPGLPYDGTGGTWTLMKSLARSGPDIYAKLKPYLDVPQYVDYMLTFMFGDSEDEYRLVGPAGMGHGAKFVLNDADGYLRTSAGNRTARNTPGKLAGDGPGSLFSMLFRDGGPDFRALLADRIQRAYVAQDGALTPARNSARLTELCNGINLAIIPECARWNYRTPANWASSRDAILTTWFPTRTSTVLGYYQTAGFYPGTAAPTTSPAAGTVAPNTMLSLTSATSGVAIYYTTDGTDPRASGDVLYNAPLITAASAGKYRVPANANDGITQANIPNLIAYYPFDTGANDAASGFNGTLTNGATVSAPGRFGAGALTLNGTNQSVSLGNPTGLQLLGQITIAAWVKPTDTTGTRNIVNKGHDTSTPNGEITLRISAGAYQGGYWQGSAGSVVTSGPATGANSAVNDLNVWTHIAIVWDGATWRLYRNGVQISSAASAVGAVTVPTIGWAIGARGTGTERFFAGQIDEVRIYNRGLTPSEIVGVFNNTATSPVATWAQTATNDSTWASATTSVGFAPPGDALLPAITQNISAGMLGVNASAYTRYAFSLTAQQRTDTSLLRLNIRADDGYVAYLNGTRVAARNAPGAIVGTSAATAETPDATALAGEAVDLSSSIPLLVNGTNVLAIQPMNVTAADDDLLLGMELTSYRGIPGIAPGAFTYSAPFPLTQNTLIRARAYSPTTKQWSGLLDAFFQVGASVCPPGALTVSELHYNPQGDDGGEFIELMNVSTGAINLRGVRFTNGVTFQFPTNRDVLLGPGQRIVLVDSEHTFQAVQGWAQQVGGIYTGSFDNGGERVTIVAADGLTTLVDFTYNAAQPWPGAADGGGRSLVLISPAPGIDLSNAANWRMSTVANGNPNSTDALTFSGNPNADLDGDGLNALLEFGLGTSDSVPNSAPIVAGFDFLGMLVTIEHAAAADSAALRAEATTDFSLWNSPVQLRSRTLLPDGRVRSVWSAPGVYPRLFLRVRTP